MQGMSLSFYQRRGHQHRQGKLHIKHFLNSCAKIVPGVPKRFVEPPERLLDRLCGPWDGGVENAVQDAAIRYEDTVDQAPANEAFCWVFNTARGAGSVTKTREP